MNELNKITKAAAWFLIGTVIFQIIGYVFRLVVSKLGIEIYGTFYLAITIFDIITLIPTLGLLTGTIRYISYYNARKEINKVKSVINTAVKATFCASIIVAIIFFIFSEKIAIILYKNQELINLLKLFSIIIPFYVLSDVFLSITEGFQIIKYRIFVSKIIEPITRLILTILLIFIGFKVMGPTIGYFISTIIVFILSFYFLKRLFPNNNLFFVKTRMDKELLIFSWPIFIGKIISIGFSGIDTLMLGMLSNINNVGLYNIATPIVSLLGLFPNAILSIFLPLITDLYARNSSELDRFYKIVTKWVFLTTVPFGLFLIFFSDHIIIILFGENYVGASISLSILAVGNLFYYLSFTNGYVITMLKKTKFSLFVSLILILANIILNYLLIPKLGIIGASISTTVMLLIYTITWFVASYYFIKINPLTFNTLKIIIAGLLAIILVNILRNIWIDSILNTIILFLLFILVYICLLFILKTLEKEDKEIIIKIKNRLFSSIE